MLHSTSAWCGKDAPVVMAGTCKAGVGFSSSLPHQHLVHRPLHLADLPLPPPDAAVPSFPAPSDGCKVPPGTLPWTSIHLSNAWRTSERNTYPWEEMPGHTAPRCDGRRARREASATPRSHPSLSKGLAGCAALQQRSSSVSPPQPTSPSPSLSATFLCNPRIDLQVL